MPDDIPYRSMRTKAGAHTTFVESGELIVDWYDFGDHAPYESLNQLKFGPEAQDQLRTLLAAPAQISTDDLAKLLAEKFDSYFDVKRFAEEHAIPFTPKVEFL